ALDGELEPEQRSQLEAHLQVCARCAALWRVLEEVEAMLTAAPLVSARPGFTNRFNARLRQQRSQLRAWLGVFVLGFSVVGAALILLPLILGMLWPFVQLLGRPATLTTLFDSASAISHTLRTVGAALWASAWALGAFAVGTPLFWLLIVTVLSATVLWIFTLRRLALRGVLL
ncbi:MAG: anti-sigma factor, partial [Anaerolineales bacterium]|nr:anti-sigma factor [Anaerolineales bacterium]